MDHERFEHIARHVEHSAEWVRAEIAAELLAEVRRLRELTDGLAARIAGQAELLARRAEKGGQP